MSRKRVAVLVLGLLPLALVLGLEWMRRRTTAQEPASLLLVTLDTLRADRVGAWGGPPGLTPVLDALAARGLVFEEALASVPLTLPSHATLFTGLEPPRHGVHDNGTYVLPADVETLATRLKASGYETGAFVGAYVLDRRFGLARGFDHYDDRIARNERGPSVLESERRGGDVVDAAAAWLRGRTGRVFAWVHLYDAHAPYDPPPPHREAHAGRPYDGEVAYVDACVGRLIDAMRAALPDRGEPLVAVVADHGESLGEHGELTHGFFVYQSTLRIPFLLAGPGVPKGERRKGIGAHGGPPPHAARAPRARRCRRASTASISSRARRPREAYAESLYPATFGWSSLRSFRHRRSQADRRAAAGALRPRGRSARGARPRRAATGGGRAPAPGDPRLARAGTAAFRRDARQRRRRAAARARLRGVRRSRRRRGRRGTARPEGPTRVYRAYEEAVWAETRGDVDAAVAGLERLVKQEPQNGLFRRSLASALRRKGRLLEAVDALGLPGRGREDAVAWHERAIALAQAGRAKEAEESEREALSLNPLLPEPHNHMGVLLARQGRAATRSRTSRPRPRSTRTTRRPGTTARTRCARSAAATTRARPTSAPRGSRPAIPTRSTGSGRSPSRTASPTRPRRSSAARSSSHRRWETPASTSRSPWRSRVDAPTRSPRSTGSCARPTTASSPRKRPACVETLATIQLPEQVRTVSTPIS